MTVGEATGASDAPTRKVVVRNWAAVLIFSIGAIGLVFSLLHGVRGPGIVTAIVGIVEFLAAYFPGMIGVLVGAAVLAFGTSQTTSIVGPGRLGKVTLLLWGILVVAAQVAFIGYLTDDAAHFAAAQSVQQTIAIASILVGVVAGVVIFRARVVTGFARISLFVTLVLFAASELLILTSDPDIGYIWDLPRLAGLVILGASYWRAGLPAKVPRAAQPVEPTIG